MQRHLRLKKTSDFQRLRQDGKTWHHRALILSVVANGLPHNRYGFIISKQIGNAVTRNKLRRRLRACLANLHDRLLSGYDMVLIARRPAVELAFTELCSVLQKHLSQANLRSLAQ